MNAAGRRVAFACIDPWLASDDKEFLPFNYAVRKVQAALSAVESAESHLIEMRLSDAESHEQMVAAIVEQIDDARADVVGLSAYVWSFPILAEAAKRLKESRPERTIVMGGPSARPAMYDLAPYRHLRPYVDALALDEGEPVMRAIVGLSERSRAALSSVPGLALPAADGWARTGATARKAPLDQYPSPYQVGLAPPGHSALVETFRGCPMGCAFCQWGEVEQVSRALSREYIRRELEAIRVLKPSSVMLVDAGLNLNPVAFRNLAAADADVDVLRGVTLHTEIYPTILRDEHVEFLHRVGEPDIGIGLQSLHPDALRLMSRPFDEERFKTVLGKLESFERVTLELIVGLPGDTPERFWYTLERLKDIGRRFRIYHCLVLPDALMTRTPETVTFDFDPRTLRMKSCTGWSERDLRDTCDRLSALFPEQEGLPAQSCWASGLPPPRVHGTAAPTPIVVAHAGLEPRTLERVVDAVTNATRGRWELESAVYAGDADRYVEMRVRVGDGTLVITGQIAGAQVAAYRVVGGIAWSHQTPLPDASAETRRTFETVLASVTPLVRDAIVTERRSPTA